MNARQLAGALAILAVIVLVSYWVLYVFLGTGEGGRILDEIPPSFPAAP
jgi:hypothetical protein